LIQTYRINYDNLGVRVELWAIMQVSPGIWHIAPVIDVRAGAFNGSVSPGTTVSLSPGVGGYIVKRPTVGSGAVAVAGGADVAPVRDAIRHREREAEQLRCLQLERVIEALELRGGEVREAQASRSKHAERLRSSSHRAFQEDAERSEELRRHCVAVSRLKQQAKGAETQLAAAYQAVVVLEGRIDKERSARDAEMECLRLEHNEAVEELLHNSPQDDWHPSASSGTSCRRVPEQVPTTVPCGGPRSARSSAALQRRAARRAADLRLQLEQAEVLAERTGELLDSSERDGDHARFQLQEVLRSKKELLRDSNSDTIGGAITVANGANSESKDDSTDHILRLSKVRTDCKKRERAASEDAAIQVSTIRRNYEARLASEEACLEAAVARTRKGRFEANGLRTLLRSNGAQVSGGDVSPGNTGGVAVAAGTPTVSDGNLQELETRLPHLQQELEARSGEANELQRKLSDCEHRLLQASEREDRLRFEVQQRLDEAERLAAECDALEASVAAQMAQSAAQAACEERASAAARIASLQSDLQAIGGELGEREKTVASLQREVGDVERKRYSRTCELARERSGLEANRRRLEEETAALRAAHAARGAGGARADALSTEVDDPWDAMSRTPGVASRSLEDLVNPRRSRPLGQGNPGFAIDGKFASSAGLKFKLVDPATPRGRSPLASVESALDDSLVEKTAFLPRHASPRMASPSPSASSLRNEPAPLVPPITVSPLVVSTCDSPRTQTSTLEQRAEDFPAKGAAISPVLSSFARDCGKAEDRSSCESRVPTTLASSMPSLPASSSSTSAEARFAGDSSSLVSSASGSTVSNSGGGGILSNASEGFSQRRSLLADLAPSVPAERRDRDLLGDLAARRRARANVARVSPLDVLNRKKNDGGADTRDDPLASLSAIRLSPFTRAASELTAPASELTAPSSASASVCEEPLGEPSPSGLSAAASAASSAGASGVTSLAAGGGRAAEVRAERSELREGRGGLFSAAQAEHRAHSEKLGGLKAASADALSRLSALGAPR